MTHGGTSLRLPTFLVLLAGLAWKNQWGGVSHWGQEDKNVVMETQPLPGLSGHAGPLRMTRLATPNMAARPLAFPQTRRGAGSCRGPLDLPIMAARRGCRAEVTAARRGGRAAGGEI